MVIKEVRDYIAEINEEAILFDNPAYDDSIIGLTNEGCVVYDLDSMIYELSQEDGMSEEEALDFIDYNTIRSLPYASSMTGSSYTPIILDSTSVDIIKDIKTEIEYNKCHKKD